jgi:ATP-dependent helicase HepA
MKCFVTHTGFGLGKVAGLSKAEIEVQFLSGERFKFARDAILEGDLKRVVIGLGTACESTRGACVIEEVLAPPRGRAVARYLVSLADGLRQEVSEEDLWPTTNVLKTEDPLELLSSLKHGGYPLFLAREQLLEGLTRLGRSSGGLSSLCASRIDLRPHQAFVAGAVLLDGRRRYLLADEVGLGKTIEAGIVIHDLLRRKQAARVLVICPPALTQQWLCELYSKFGGQTFVLPELHTGTIAWKTTSRAIVGFTDLVCSYGKGIEEHLWDLVVVDEAHHLVDSESLFNCVSPIARDARSLLLLSALPARRREDELLRLLSLLEPSRYSVLDESTRSRFTELFELQSVIGRKLNLLKRRVDGLTIGDFTIAEAREKAIELLELPVVRDDQSLKHQLSLLSEVDEAESVQASLRQFMLGVADRYRVNRRILRNRRENLIAQEEMVAVQRVFSPCGYEPDQLEIDVHDAAQVLLEDARTLGIADDLLELLVRILWQSFASPQNATDVVLELQSAQIRSQNLSEKGRSYLALGHHTGYSGWKTFLGLFSIAVTKSLSADSLKRLASAIDRWRRHGEPKRFSKLKDVLQRVTPRQAGAKSKLIVFAGFPGLAVDATAFLRRTFSPEAVGEFRWDMGREEKEASVRDFRQRNEKWLLVCDETGGEGRNFQFANEVVHLDTPWHVSRIEQRIGRLDRLGREQVSPSEVISNVLFCERSTEAGLIRCVTEGFGVYERSISGLEFSLRNAEDEIALTAVTSGAEGLYALAPKLRDQAEAERVRDEAEALLDEASFNRTAAQAFRRVKNAREIERDVETTFCRYVELIAKRPKEVSDEEFPGSILRFRPDTFHQIQLQDAAQFGEGCLGTFRREVAQQRLDMQFFTVGNPFFDTVCRSLHEQTCGRTYAVEASLTDVEPWGGFEFVYVPELPSKSESGSYGLFNRIEAILATDPLHIFCGVDEQFADGLQWLKLRRSILPEHKDLSWSNITKEKARRLQDTFGGVGWTTLVQSLKRSAELRARQEFSERLSGVITAEEQRLEILIAQLSHMEASVEEIEVLRSWQQSLMSWSVRLDAVGFLSINSWLTRRGPR